MRSEGSCFAERHTPSAEQNRVLRGSIFHEVAGIFYICCFILHLILLFFRFIITSMSTHINAPEGAIADTVLLPGDPLRAKFIAETFLEDAKCYNEVRGMFGFTGTYKGKRTSIPCFKIRICTRELFRTRLLLKRPF